MKVERLPRSYFEKFSDNPVILKPFDPQSKQQALRYMAALNEHLAPLDVAAELHGSVELGIAGKGEWEYAIYLNDDNWYRVLKQMINHFGSIYELMDDFALFDGLDGFENLHGDTDTDTDIDIEVILMRGETAEQNRAIMAYWRSHPAALVEYERLKHQHKYAKRAYYWWKSNFIADILETL